MLRTFAVSGIHTPASSPSVPHPIAPSVGITPAAGAAISPEGLAAAVDRSSKSTALIQLGSAPYFAWHTTPGFNLSPQWGANGDFSAEGAPAGSASSVSSDSVTSEAEGADAASDGSPAYDNVFSRDHISTPASCNGARLSTRATRLRLSSDDFRLMHLSDLGSPIGHSADPKPHSCRLPCSHGDSSTGFVSTRSGESPSTCSLQLAEMSAATFGHAYASPSSGGGGRCLPRDCEGSPQGSLSPSKASYSPATMRNRVQSIDSGHALSPTAAAAASRAQQMDGSLGCLSCCSEAAASSRSRTGRLSRESVHRSSVASVPHDASRQRTDTANVLTFLRAGPFRGRRHCIMVPTGRPDAWAGAAQVKCSRQARRCRANANMGMYRFEAADTKSPSNDSLGEFSSSTFLSFPPSEHHIHTSPESSIIGIHPPDHNEGLLVTIPTLSPSQLYSTGQKLSCRTTADTIASSPRQRPFAAIVGYHSPRNTSMASSAANTSDRLTMSPEDSNNGIVATSSLLPKTRTSASQGDNFRGLDISPSPQHLSLPVDSTRFRSSIDSPFCLTPMNTPIGALNGSSVHHSQFHGPSVTAGYPGTDQATSAVDDASNRSNSSGTDLDGHDACLLGSRPVDNERVSDLVPQPFTAVGNSSRRQYIRRLSTMVSESYQSEDDDGFDEEGSESEHSGVTSGNDRRYSPFHPLTPTSPTPASPQPRSVLDFLMDRRPCSTTERRLAEQQDEGAEGNRATGAKPLSLSACAPVASSHVSVVFSGPSEPAPKPANAACTYGNVVESRNGLPDCESLTVAQLPAPVASPPTSSQPPGATSRNSSVAGSFLVLCSLLRRRRQCHSPRTASWTDSVEPKPHRRASALTSPRARRNDSSVINTPFTQQPCGDRLVSPRKDDAEVLPTSQAASTTSQAGGTLARLLRRGLRRRRSRNSVSSLSATGDAMTGSPTASSIRAPGSLPMNSLIGTGGDLGAITAGFQSTAEPAADGYEYRRAPTRPAVRPHGSDSSFAAHHGAPRTGDQLPGPRVPRIAHDNSLKSPREFCSEQKQLQPRPSSSPHRRKETVESDVPLLPDSFCGSMPSANNTGCGLHHYRSLKVITDREPIQTPRRRQRAVSKAKFGCKHKDTAYQESAVVDGSWGTLSSATIPSDDNGPSAPSSQESAVAASVVE